MKTALLSLSFVFLSTASQAETGCNPAKGNWVNAAPTTCPIATFSNQGGQALPHKKKCDHEDTKKA